MDKPDGKDLVSQVLAYVAFMQDVGYWGVFPRHIYQMGLPYSERQIRRIMVLLCERGLLVRVSQRGGYRIPSKDVR